MSAVVVVLSLREPAVYRRGGAVAAWRRQEIGQLLSFRPGGHRGRHRADRLDAEQL
jgi:hypothetical protein